MNYLVDTNVISELRKAGSNPKVEAWFHANSATSLFLSAVTVSELLFGIESLPGGRRQQELLAWWTDVLSVEYADRIIPFGVAEAKRCGRLMARDRKSGFEPSLPDSMIAATALEQGFTVATRNIADFQRAGVDVLNPWSA